MGELVSIITPMYNAEKYIESTIESVRKQTYKNWEMIIVDDCSTDKSPEIVKKNAAEDTRIRYFRNPENSGVANTRNHAMKQATGRYLAFLDSDDLWDEDKLEKQLVFMQKENAHFCCSGCRIIDENGIETGVVRKVKGTRNRRQLLRGNVAACLTIIIDRKFLPDPIMPDIHHEDYAAWLGIIRENEMVYCMEEVLASYRVGSGSLSGNKKQAALWTWNIYRNYLDLPLYKAGYLFICYVYHAVRKRI